CVQNDNLVVTKEEAYPALIKRKPPGIDPASVLVSVVMPVYNEPRTIREIVQRIEDAPVRKEIIAVDDCSTDGTSAILAGMARAGRIRLFRHKVNMGKGAAVRTGLKQIQGDIVVIQDADLEYDPAEYPQLIAP